MIETRRVQHRFEVAMDRALRTRGISFAQFRALEVLLGSPEMHVSELARRLRLTRQTVGSTVEKLVRADLVDTQHERGLTYVTASPVTREHVDRIRHAVEQLHMAIQQELTPAGCGQLVLLLRRADGSLAAPLTEAWRLDP